MSGTSPIAARGMRIGLLGGSFNPAHEAHRAASLFALKRLGLDRIWWLVSPGNPLKDIHNLPPVAERARRARAVARHPRIDVTDIECTLGTRFSFDTVTRLRQRFPGVRFVFLVGADILAEFHRWHRWRELAGAVPLAVIDRPDFAFRALASPAAIALAHARIPEHAGANLLSQRPPGWVFLHCLKLSLSSTALRKKAPKALLP